MFQEEDKIVKCEIELDRIFFPKNVYRVESGNFAIFLARVIKIHENAEYISDKKFIKLKGNVCNLETYVTYNVTCKVCEPHPIFGETFEIMFIKRQVDLTSKSKQMDFLGAIINPNIVTKLFEKYEDVVSLLETKNIKELTSINGIGRATAMRIIQEYEDSKDYSMIYTELNDLTLTPVFLKKLLDFYKSPSTVVDIIRNNPYRLIEVSGIGFNKADEVAQKIGIVGNDSRRVRAFIIYVLSEAGEIGKSFLHYSELVSNIYETIGFVEQDILNNVADDLIKSKQIFVSEDGQYIGLYRYYKLEMNIYHELLRLNNAQRVEEFELGDWEHKVTILEEEQGFVFTQEQKDTIQLAVDPDINILVITGSGGTGKTALANAFSAVYNNYYIDGAALSGKAAVRIKEATGIDAKTIHRLLGYQFGKFTYCEEMPLELDVLIIDESTMINGDIFLAILKALKNGTKLILLGDFQQLSPIGNCQVFTDILNGDGVIKISKLTQLHRQAQRSGIIPTSIKIINQEQIFQSNFEGNMILGELEDMELDIFKDDIDLSDKVVEHFIKHYQISNNVIETQVVAPMRTRGSLSTYNLNTKIQQLINPVSADDRYIEVMIKEDKKNKKDKEDKEHKIYKIKLGDKVINTKNNYKAIDIEGNTTPVFNGNMGIVIELDYNTAVVDFIGIGQIVLDNEGVKNLELAYACTVHKLQGSGFDRVIFCLDSSAFMLLNAELVYTGLTRAKKYCVLVGRNSAIRTAINKREVKLKQTYLKYLLQSIN